MTSGAASASERGRICASCRHFNHDARDLEAALPGLRTLSSAHAAVRSDDGLCGVHDRYVASHYTCPRYEALSGT